MKKCLKIVALCGIFVLLLSIMLISNIPKTYANMSFSIEESPVYLNVYSPDNWFFMEWYDASLDIYYDVVQVRPMEFYGSYLPQMQYRSSIYFYEPVENITLDVNMNWVDMGMINSNVNDRYFRWSMDEPQFSGFLLHWDELFLPSSTIVSEHIPVYSDLSLGIELNDVIFDITYSYKSLSPDSSYPISNSQTITYTANGSYLSLIPDFIFTDLTSYGGVKYIYDYDISFVPREWVGTGWIDYRIYGYDYGDVYLADYSQLSRNYFANYFDSGGSSIEMNFGAWLLENANAFLAFELLPGFSLSSLLALLVGIPLLLWLFKMLLGG